jgi:hypothetical protein
MGYIEGRNLAIEYRYAPNENDRLRQMAADLVRRGVAVIFVAGTPAALAAKAATSTIPIVFSIGSDPVQMGLVVSLNRPGGNVTGVANMSIEVEPKLFRLLHELVPPPARFGALVNPSNPVALDQRPARGGCDHWTGSWGGEGGRTDQNCIARAIAIQRPSRYIQKRCATGHNDKSPNLLYRDGDESVCNALLGTILSFQDLIPSQEIPKT